MSCNPRRDSLRAAALLLLVPYASLAPTAAQKDAWKQTLERKFDDAYVVTKFRPDLSGIEKPGTVLVVMREGVRGDLVSDGSTSTTVVKDGQIKQAGGFLRDLGEAMTPNRKEASLFLQPGERVYLTNVRVSDKDVTLMIVSCEVRNLIVAGTTNNSRYKALLKFEFPKDYLPTADFANVKAVVESVLANEKGVQSAAPKSIALGQSPEEVEQILGPPKKIANLGAKVIYFYDDMKVVFVEGKVSDVE